ncbi:MAG: PAS-domain containing protein [Rhizobiales bacterium]|nr:PAS-domain containing protein [Hyphomicrobiales bacterium]
MTADPPPGRPLRGLAALRDQLRSREISILISGGVALLVLIILVGAASAVLGLRTIAQGYGRQQSFSAVVQTATAIDENLLRLRIAASEYLMSGRALDKDKMIEASRALVSRVDAGSLALREVGFGEVVDALRARLDLQRSVIETLGELRERRARKSDEFVQLSNNALEMLDEIVPRAFEFGDFEGSNRALRVRENLLAAQGEVLVWLLSRRKTSLAMMDDRWTELVSATRRLQFTLRETRDRDATARVRDKVEPQSALIMELDRATQDESNLDRVLDQENGLIQALSDQLRTRATQGEAVLTARLNATFDRARQWTILFASLAGMVGLLSAAYSFQRTVRPIRRITRTLDSLASGQLETPVPFVDARNELGQMARAADVFKNAMIEVQRSRAVFQTVLDNLPDGVMLFDRDRRWLMWNRRLVEYQRFPPDFAKMGVGADEIIRYQADRGDFGPGDPEEHVRVGLERMWASGGARYHRRDSAGRFIEFNFIPLPGGELLAYYRDLTEMKETQEAVQKATELLQDAIEGLASGFAIYDERDRLMIWNSRFENLTPHLDGFRKAGATLEEMLRGALAAGRIAEAKGKEEEWLSLFLTRHQEATERGVTRLDDGRWVHIEKQRTNANHIVSVFTDVSDMKRGEQAVRDARERLQDAIESLGSGFVLCDPDSRLIAWNSRMREMLPGLADEMRIGARFGDVVRAALTRGILRSEQKSDDWIAERRESRDARPAGYVSETTVETSLGRWLRMTRQKSASGNIVAILVDITEMKNREIELDALVSALEAARDAAYKAQRDAEAANQAKSTFLATMSHEIRTPMNGVLGMLEVLEHGQLGDRQRTQVRLARQSAMSLLNIIDDVLDFSKIEAGRLELETVDVDMLSLVEGVAETMTESARRKGLALYAETDPLLPEIILGDPTRLRQILFNLVGNAIKFTEAGSVSIVVESIAREGRALMRLTVADTGIGMTPEQRERLFVPFEQADATTTRRFGGTGLGLSIVARLVELMGGAIAAQSAPGHGSVFTVEVPVRAGAAPDNRPQPLAGVSVAVAMADSDAARRLAGHLARAGASIEILSPEDEARPADAGAACDLLIAERAMVFDARAAARPRCPRRRVYLDGWDARPADEFSRSAPMPWRVDGVIAAAAALVGRTAPAALRKPMLASDRWVHDLSEPAPHPANDAAPLAAADRSAPRRNILIVDDHPVNREVIRRQLELLGHESDEAENGSSAFALWQSGRHRIVITDCHMPVLDGFGLTAAIRAAEEGDARRTPIVALTANALAGESERCLAAGMDDYLAKPVPLEKLRATIERWLEPGAPAPRAPAREPQDRPEPALDRSVLADLFGDDDATIDRLIGSFVETTRAALADIDQAFDRGDAPSISDIAHRMKGSARMVGARKLAEVAEEIEKAAKAGDVAAARAHLRGLQSAVENTLRAARG